MSWTFKTSCKWSYPRPDRISLASIISCCSAGGCGFECACSPSVWCFYIFLARDYFLSPSYSFFGSSKVAVDSSFLCLIDLTMSFLGVRLFFFSFSISLTTIFCSFCSYFFFRASCSYFFFRASCWFSRSAAFSYIAIFSFLSKSAFSLNYLASYYALWASEYFFSD